MTENINPINDLCKDCKYRFRRVMMPLRPEEYVDENGNRLLEGDENIIITNQCLIAGMDLDGDITIECDSYERRDDEEDEEMEPVTFFRHLK